VNRQITVCTDSSLCVQSGHCVRTDSSLCAQTVQQNVGRKIMDYNCVMEGQILSFAVLPNGQIACCEMETKYSIG